MAVAKLSAERLKTVQRYLIGEGVPQSGLSPEAKLALTVGLLICDEAGRVPKDDLAEAMADSSILQVARAQLARATRAVT